MKNCAKYYWSTLFDVVCTQLIRDNKACFLLIFLLRVSGVVLSVPRLCANTTLTKTDRYIRAENKRLLQNAERILYLKDGVNELLLAINE